MRAAGNSGRSRGPRGREPGRSAWRPEPGSGCAPAPPPEWMGGVARGRLAAQPCTGVEVALVVVEPLHVVVTQEEVRLLHRRHGDVRMPPQIEVEAGGPGLGGADDE